MVYYVYIHTLPNGKIYVGMCKNPYIRWNNGNGYRENKEFFNDITKYGWTNIKHEIIDKFFDEETAILHERLYISLLDAENPEIGYNKTHYKKMYMDYFQNRVDIIAKPGWYKMVEYHNNDCERIKRYGEILSYKSYSDDGNTIEKYVIKYLHAIYKITKENNQWKKLFCLKRKNRKMKDNEK